MLASERESPGCLPREEVKLSESECSALLAAAFEVAPECAVERRGIETGDA